MYNSGTTAWFGNSFSGGLTIWKYLFTFKTRVLSKTSYISQKIIDSETNFMELTSKFWCFKISLKITYSKLMMTAANERKNPLPGNSDDIKILSLSYQMDTVTVSEVTHYWGDSSSGYLLFPNHNIPCYNIWKIFSLKESETNLFWTWNCERQSWIIH